MNVNYKAKPILMAVIAVSMILVFAFGNSSPASRPGGAQQGRGHDMRPDAPVSDLLWKFSAGG